MSSTAVVISPNVSAARGITHRRAFVSAALVATILFIVGFWPTYFGPLLAGTAVQPAIIHIHVVVMVAWLALFALQVWFAASGRVRLHIRLGPWVTCFGVVLVVVGLLAISNGFATRLKTGDVSGAQRLLFGPLPDLAFFVPCLAAGWLSRRRPEVHKRAMLVATTVLVMPAIGRMSFLGFPVVLWKLMLV
jgi:hypothetical protein